MNVCGGLTNQQTDIAIYASASTTENQSQQDWCMHFTRWSFSRTHCLSEFLPWVMTPVNSTSLRASTSNQWLFSSGSAHHAPPYRSSSLSEPCRWPYAWSLTFLVLRTDLSFYSWHGGLTWSCVCIPACWGVPSGPWSHDETERKPATGRLLPGETPSPEEDILSGKAKQHRHT